MLIHQIMQRQVPEYGSRAEPSLFCQLVKWPSRAEPSRARSVTEPHRVEPSRASKRAAYIKKIHEKTKEAIELKAVRKAASMNKHRKKVLFELGDLVWIHLHKDRFPDQRKSKLMPRGDGPFRVLAKINDNSYKIDLPSSYGVSNTFNVADLLPYTSEDTSESRMTPFQGEEDDMTTPLSNTLQPPSHTTST
jgi:hypothetical protein